MKNKVPKTFFISLLLLTLVISIVSPLSYGEDISGDSINLGLYSHKLSYFHPISHVDSAGPPHYESEHFANRSKESVYQFSFKIPLIGKGLFPNIYGAYTQKAYWQVYDEVNSRPFRETNYNPELFLRLGSPIFTLDFGVEHQSNGEADPDSRAWDILYAKVGLNLSFLSIYLKGWHLYDEDQKGGVQNRYIFEKQESITHYYGYGEAQIIFRTHHFELGFYGRHNRSRKKGAYRVDLLIRGGKKIGLHAQYFRGYGDSLIDYNRLNSRVGVGFLLGQL
jgi:phospholipase A1